MHRSKMSTIPRPSTNTGRSRGRTGDKLLPGPELTNAAFLFAKLPINEIQEDLAVFMELELSVEELKLPAPETVKDIIGFFINKLFGKRPEEMAQSEFGCIDQIDYPELFEDAAIAHITFLRYATKLFHVCMFDAFGLRDIHGPERSRFQWQMSALINLTRFREKRHTVFEEMVAYTEERVQVEKKLREDRNKLQLEIDGIKAARDSEQPELDEANESVRQHGLRLAEHHQQQIFLTDKTHQRKEVLAKLHETQEALALKVQTDRDEVNRLQARVVSSPDRVKAEFRNMADTLESERAYISSMRRRTREIVARYEGLKKVLTQAEILRHGTADALEKLKLRKRLLTEVETLSTRRAELQSEFQACHDSKAHYEKNMASITARIARCDEQKSNIMNGNTGNDQERANQLRHYQATYEDKCRQRDEKNAVADALEKEILQMAQARSDESSNLWRKQHLVLERMEAYSKDMFAVQEILQSANGKARDAFIQLAQPGSS